MSFFPINIHCDIPHEIILNLKTEITSCPLSVVVTKCFLNSYFVKHKKKKRQAFALRRAPLEE